MAINFENKISCFEKRARGAEMLSPFALLNLAQ
jgi:hypothetical protein